MEVKVASSCSRPSRDASSLRTCH